MTDNKEVMRFPYPWRGIGVLVVFLLLAPPVQVVVAAFMEHDFIGGRQILFEIGAVLRERVVPFLLSGYSFYMPPVFFAALMSAWRPAQGLALTVSGAIGRMVLCGLACEVFYQCFVVIAGGAWRADIVLVGLVQWIISGFVCFLAAAQLGLSRPARAER
ncbi:hypothetical protein [Candidatus Tokpelaia sp.]|uniref:hypothetical protein n=1 Tax=Candidatus Tokpelaia sp. TaxID=2233777 RepID=UPI001239B663|nr:hypothetical protein [Candidatus Tokpelaia sp.]KAA6404601.1 hypothetical protein DPQ22_08965 [Candidatus Tokpelaia sp.]